MSANHPTRKEVLEQIEKLRPEDQVKVAKAILDRFKDPDKYRQMPAAARRGLVKIFQSLHETVTSALLERQLKAAAPAESNESDLSVQDPPKLRVVRTALRLVKPSDDDGPGAA